MYIVSLFNIKPMLYRVIRESFRIRLIIPFVLRDYFPGERSNVNSDRGVPLCSVADSRTFWVDCRVCTDIK